MCYVYQSRSSTAFAQKFVRGSTFQLAKLSSFKSTKCSVMPDKVIIGPHFDRYIILLNNSEFDVSS